jgi:transcriptional regulator with XRE-family HTH domain
MTRKAIMNKNNKSAKSIKNVVMIEKFNIERAGTRLRIIRTMTGTTRPQLCKALGFHTDRLRNLETHKQKLNEDDIEALARYWPLFSDYIMTGGAIRLDPSKELIQDKASKLLLEHPEQLATAQAIKNTAGIDLVRAALTLPAFRKAIKAELKKLINEATKKARKDAC